MISPPDVSGMLHLLSLRPVAETMDRLIAVAKHQGLTIFARIDFASDAAANGLTMRGRSCCWWGIRGRGRRRWWLLPTVAIDLPLKVLAWEDGAGQVWVSINTPEYLRERHGFPAKLMGNIAGLEGLVRAVVTSFEK